MDALPENQVNEKGFLVTRLKTRMKNSLPGGQVHENKIEDSNAVSGDHK